LEDIQEDINQLFDFSQASYPQLRESRLPASDIYEDEKNIYVEADLPGFEQKDIKVSLKDGSLRISAKKEEKSEVTRKTFQRRERIQGSFERIIPLANKVEVGKIKAHYKDGVLKLTLPKTQEEKEKEIEISVE
jgi:HSP20 family protein